MPTYFILDFFKNGKIVDKIGADSQEEAIKKWARKQDEFTDEGWVNTDEFEAYGVVARSNIGEWQPTSRSWAEEYK